MSASVRLNGFDDLIHMLTNAPDEIRAEAREIVHEYTEATASEVARTYVVGKTGNLSRRVKTFYPSSEVIVGIVQSASPHAHLYEFGTKQRHNDRGANRGRMPARPVTPHVAQKNRLAMFLRLTALLTERGFVVSHD